MIDTTLAVTAIEHDLYLVMRNVKDASLSGATIFDPWKDVATEVPTKPAFLGDRDNCSYICDSVQAPLDKFA